MEERKGNGVPTSNVESREKSSDGSAVLTDKQKHLLQEHVELFDTMGINAPLEVIEEKVRQLKKN